MATGFSKEKNIFLAILIRGTVNFSKKLQQDEQDEDFSVEASKFIKASKLVNWKTLAE